MNDIPAKDRAELLAGLLDGRWEVRRSSALGLMNAPPEAADLARLAALLHDPKVEVRHAVVIAIAVAHGPGREAEVVPLLVERALTDASLRVRRQAVSMLAWQLAHPDLEGFFAQLAASESDEKLVRFAARRAPPGPRAREAGGRAVLSREQRAEFEERGLLRLRGLVDSAVVAELRARVAERIRTLAPDPAPPGFAVHASATASLVKRVPFAEVWGGARRCARRRPRRRGPLRAAGRGPDPRGDVSDAGRRVARAAQGLASRLHGAGRAVRPRRRAALPLPRSRGPARRSDRRRVRHAPARRRAPPPRRCGLAWPIAGRAPAARSGGAVAACAHDRSAKARIASRASSTAPKPATTSRSRWPSSRASLATSSRCTRGCCTRRR